MKKLLLIGLMAFTALISFYSCTEKESLDTYSEIPARKGDTEDLFRAALERVVNFVEDADRASNGDLGTLIKRIAQESPDEINRELSRSGLIDMIALDQLVQEVHDYAEILEEEVGAASMAQMVSQTTFGTAVAEISERKRCWRISHVDALGNIEVEECCQRSFLGIKGKVRCRWL